MKVHCVTCARKGSVRLPNKNIKLLSGIPLIEHTFLFIEKCINHKIFDHGWLLTNDDRVKKIAKKYNINSSYKRPNSDSLPQTSVTETVKNWLVKMEFCENDKIMLLQPTSPFRFIEDCKNIVKSNLLENEQIVGGVKMPGNIKDYISSNTKTKLNLNENLIFIDGSYYCTTVRRILNGEGFKFIKTDKFFITKMKLPIDIDFIEDIQMAELINVENLD